VVALVAGLIRPWTIAAALVLLSLAGLAGYRLGYGISDGQHAKALLEAQRSAYEAAELASKKEAERLALLAERDALARELDAQAYADPDGARPALGAASVRRLNSR
jgi:hypothetical protein